MLSKGSRSPCSSSAAIYGHGAMVNTCVLRMVGVSDTARDPVGGCYERVSRTRMLTGVIDGSAQYAPTDAYFSSAPQALVDSIRAVAAEPMRLGATTIQHMNSHFSASTAERIFTNASLPVRLRVIQWPYPGQRADWRHLANRRLTPLTYVSGVKYVVVATPIEQWPSCGGPTRDGPAGMAACTTRRIPSVRTFRTRFGTGTSL